MGGTLKYYKFDHYHKVLIKVEKCSREEALDHIRRPRRRSYEKESTEDSEGDKGTELHIK